MTSGNTSSPLFPARLRPEWRQDLPETLRMLMDELYATLEQGAASAPVMVLRALVDCFIQETVGAAGSFEQKLTAMERQGFISAHDKRRLRVIIDAGSAATHRGTPFTPPHIGDMLDCVEALLRAHWVLGPRLQKLEAQIPARPARPRKP